MKIYSYTIVLFILITCNTNQSSKLNINDKPKIGVLDISLNENRWRANFYFNTSDSISILKGYYDIDSIDVVLFDKQLSEILLNKNEDYFHFDYLRITDSSLPNPINLNELLVNDFSDNVIRGKIIIDDINFDGYKDLLLHNSLLSGASNSYHDIWIYQPKVKSYILWKKSLHLGLWNLNKELKQLELGIKNGGGLYYKEIIEMQTDTISEIVMKETVYLKQNKKILKKEVKKKGQWVVTFAEL